MSECARLFIIVFSNGNGRSRHQYDSGNDGGCGAVKHRL